MSLKRYAVLQCAEDYEYIKNNYGGYFGVFKEMLAEPGEEWDLFLAVRGELPRDEAEIELYDGFVVTGSCWDAHGNDPWILDLLEFLKKLDSLKKKVLGICFGHQLLSRALGGKIGRAGSWDIGLRNLQLSTTSNLFSSTAIPKDVSIIECHQDEVKELPSKAEVIARSDKTAIEMFRFGDHIMGIQGHPECNKDILLYLIDRLLQNTSITESYADDRRANIGACETDKEAWRTLCISFLKGTPAL